jgi:glycerol-3-phosphate acyltransferase PlsX
MNPDEYGGAAILGVNGVCVKGHGSSKARAVECAINVVRRTVDLGVNQRIVERIQQLNLAASSQE